MPKLTTQDLEAIRKRAEAATEGPWKWSEGAICLLSTEGGGVVGTSQMRQGWKGDLYFDAWDADLDFIAHAREDIPALLAEVEHYSGKISFYLDEIERLRSVVFVKDVEIAKWDEMVDRLRTVIEDFAKHGTRHDTTPTIGGRIKSRDDVLGFYEYMRSMDDSVRRRAKEAIRNDSEA